MKSFSDLLSVVLSYLPADFFSFLAGVVFAAAISLPIALIEPRKIPPTHLLLIVIVLFISMYILLWINQIVKKSSRSDEELVHQSRMRRNLGAHWRKLAILLVLSIALLLLAITLLNVYRNA